MLIRILAIIRGLIYACGFALVWWWLVVTVRPLDNRIPVAIPYFMRIPGIVAVISGVAIGFWCVVVFAFVGKGTPAPFDAPREFVAVGPYRYLRNPMYVGAFAVIIGSALILRSLSAFAVAIFFIVLANVFILIYEEPALEHRFGQSYLQYKRSVNRWLPGKPKDSTGR